MTTEKMTDDEKIVRAVAKLVGLTARKKLKWNKRVNFRDDKNIAICYVTQYEGERLALYKRTVDVPIMGVSRGGGDVQFVTAPSPPENVLEFIDEKDDRIWEFPRKRVIDDLMRAVESEPTQKEGLGRIDRILGANA